MKKFVRHRKTFNDSSTSTPPGAVYVLDKEKGGPPDQTGGGLVRELPSSLIGRLRDDLKFAAKINSGAAKSNGKLKEEMAVITRDAYVSKGVARKRLGQVLKQKVARGRESIQFFKHNLAKQKVASLKAAQIHVHSENTDLKIRIGRKNHELGVQATALKAIGEVSAFDEHMLRRKDTEISDLKDVVDKLHHDLLQEKKRTEVYKEQKKDTQTQLYRAYSTLGKLAMKSGKASDKALLYDLNQDEESIMIKEHVLKNGEDGNVSNVEREYSNEKEIKEQERKRERKNKKSKEFNRRNKKSPILTPVRTTKSTTNSKQRRPQSATPSTRRRQRTQRKSILEEVLSSPSSSSSPFSPSSPSSPSTSSSFISSSKSRKKPRPSSAHTRSKSKYKKKPHPYLERGRKYGKRWQAPSKDATPLRSQTTSIFPKSQAHVEPPLLQLKSDRNGRKRIKIRAGFNDCYSQEHLTALLTSTGTLPMELRPNEYFPPPPAKGWQQLMKEENDRLSSKHKDERSHRYLRWYPSVGRGQETPPLLKGSPLRVMAEEEYGPSDPRKIIHTPVRKRSSISVMADWLEKSRDRRQEISGSGMTGEREHGIEQGPNLNQTLQILPVPKNQKEIELLEKKEKEDMGELYAISRKHNEYPNNNKMDLFEFDENVGKYRHTHDNMPESEMTRKMNKAKSAPVLNQNQNNSEKKYLPVSKDPKADRRKSKRRRPKSAGLSRKKSKALLDRLTNSVGSKFKGPGIRVDRHIVKTSGSAAYQMKRMREKIRKKAMENANDDD